MNLGVLQVEHLWYRQYTDSTEYYNTTYLSIRKVSGHLNFFLLADIGPCLGLKNQKEFYQICTSSRERIFYHQTEYCWAGGIITHSAATMYFTLCIVVVVVVKLNCFVHCYCIQLVNMCTIHLTLFQRVFSTEMVPSLSSYLRIQC